MDYLHHVNNLHPQLNEEKTFMLMSLGLPSHFAQQTLLTHKPGICDLITPSNTKVKLNAECYGGKHRYSFRIGERRPDDDMVKGLMTIYQDRFDGYIIPHEWPSCYHGGSFHPEVCLFRPKNTLLYVDSATFKKGGKKVTKKGGKNIPCVDDHDGDPPTIEYTNMKNESHLQAINWKGPRIYDADGILKTPTYDEIMRYRSLCLPIDLSDYARDNVLASRRSDGVYTPLFDDEYWNTVIYNNDPIPKKGGTRRKNISPKST